MNQLMEGGGDGDGGGGGDRGNGGEAGSEEMEKTMVAVLEEEM